MQAHPSHGAGCPFRPKEVPASQVLLRLAHRHRRLPLHVKGQGGHPEGRGEGGGRIRHLQLHRDRRDPAARVSHL